MAAADHLVPPPVDRRLLLETELVTVRDNVCTRDDPAPSDETTPLPFHELSIPLTGVWVLRRGDRRSVFGPGSVHLLPRGLSYRAEHPCGCGNDRNLGVAFADDLRSELTLAGASASEVWSRRSLGERDLALVGALVGALRRGDAATLDAEEAVLALLTRVTASDADAPFAGSAATRRAHAALVERVESSLIEHVDGPITLTRLARAAHSSPHHMSRVFRATTGVTIGARLRAIRLFRALDLLLDTTLPLRTISGMTGYADAAHLCRAFRGALGMTPGRFRASASSELVGLARRRLESRGNN